jgi:hypothetical protein
MLIKCLIIVLTCGGCNELFFHHFLCSNVASMTWLFDASASEIQTNGANFYSIGSMLCDTRIEFLLDRDFCTEHLISFWDHLTHLGSFFFGGLHLHHISSVFLLHRMQGLALQIGVGAAVGMGRGSGGGGGRRLLLIGQGTLATAWLL